MATAPRPGVGARNDAVTAAQTVMTITIKRPIFHDGRPVAETHTIAPGNLPMRERLICRKATGLPLSAFWAEDRIDLDSLVVLWWLARRLNGEATLTFDQAAADWPNDLDPETDLDISIDTPGEDTDDPEA